MSPLLWALAIYYTGLMSGYFLGKRSGYYKAIKERSEIAPIWKDPFK